ncbi:hypothetical protein I4641_11290 [Waterburya agarophytonicola K14]|uniref:Uncharacterized protein n=1 Tax=Waterburya agarophytonicola KI4 TaxID=2874699 RepID=A0A964BRR5_9CYAN|nr:DUF6391 domain-containing protein [Waterburya agarophytonicola]MCC0177562.1 hypothetical protein [Waterburya agarophytonicola KI4]
MNDASYLNPKFDFTYTDPDRDSQLINQLGFIPGLKEFLMIRQVHALEHATVWMLSDITGLSKAKLSTSYLSADNENIGGLSTEKGFYIYGDINSLRLTRAVKSALTRLQKGEWNLALHPRCGTNSSVAMLLTAGMAMTAHLTLPRSPVHQFMGMGLATLAANYLAPDLGIYVQKYITTSIPFNLELKKITKIIDKSGDCSYFVRLDWV